MRILYLADIRFPLERANGIQTAETCGALAARGHAVTLLVRPDTIRPARDPFTFYDLGPESRFEIRHALSRGPAQAKRLMYLSRAVAAAAAGGAFDVVMTRDLGVASAVLHVPRSLRPPVVFESHGFAPVFAGTLNELVAGASPASDDKRRRLERREARVWRLADVYISTTQVLAEELRGRFGRRDRVFAIPNGARVATAPPQRATAFRTPPTIVYAGHLYPWKGADVFVEALARLPSVSGVIIGGHPKERDLDRVKRLVSARGLSDRVALTGPLRRDEVAAALAQADILVLPTVATASARYTSPLKLFEYLAAGKPIIASDLPSIREIVTHGESALLVRPGDPGALGRAVSQLLDDPAMAARLAGRAFELAHQYSWARRAEHLERAFASVAAA